MERNADCLQAFVLTQDVYRGNLDRLFSSCLSRSILRSPPGDMATEVWMRAVCPPLPIVEEFRKRSQRGGTGIELTACGRRTFAFDGGSPTREVGRKQALEELPVVGHAKVQKLVNDYAVLKDEGPLQQRL
jgi:hypothetical protein